MEIKKFSVVVVQVARIDFERLLWLIKAPSDIMVL
tara:strand:+ start:587 stop:691 length:105 start_codon:yes stop_codon:yes gene_type:complete